MRINVGSKLWLAFFSTLSLCVLAMYLLLHGSLKRGFLDYTSQQAVQRLDVLRSALINIHREQGSFMQLQDDPQRWLELKTIIFAHSDSFYQPNSHSIENAAQTPEHYYREFVRSITLHDAQQQLLLGLVKPEQTLSRVPLYINNNVVGFIGFVKPTVVTREADKRFIQHQLRVFGIISIIILIISVAVSTLVARRISRPLKTLAQGAQALAAGNYSSRIKVTSNDELGQLCSHFNSLAHTLAASEQSRARWIADISHEMRTPVAVLKAQIEALQDGIRAFDHTSLSLLQQKVDSLNRLIDDLFELSLADMGALNYNKEFLGLPALLHPCVEQFKLRAQEANLVLHNHLTKSESPVVFADPKRLEQLANNLLENAVRYTHSGGTIVVSIEANDAYATLIVADSAPGVAADQHEKIFERLYRLEPSRNRNTGGAGLGLAICKNIVTAHDGIISARTSALGGLEVRVQLPIAQ